MSVRFLDTNILLRYVLRDDEAKARAAFALLARVEQGEEKVETSPLVIFETIFTLQKRYRVPREEIQQALSDILSLRGLSLPNKSIYECALELYTRQNISFADAYNAAYMAARGLSEIYSFDRDFDKLEGIARVEPAEKP